MRTVAVTPILGEFGFIVFDIQPRVRAWLRGQEGGRKIVFAPKSLKLLFEEATEVIEPPIELLPVGPPDTRSIARPCWNQGNPERGKIERLVAWSKSVVSADEWLEIPYFSSEYWPMPATNVLLEGSTPIEADPYVVIAARSRGYAPWRNWPKEHWNELVGRIQTDWRVDVRCIGRPPSTYFPEDAIGQNVDEESRLDSSLSLLNNALCSISSNSGPTHLSLMAGCPTFAWGESGLKRFVEEITNPLKAPCHLCEIGWSPAVGDVWDRLNHWRARLVAAGRWRAAVDRSIKVSMCMIVRDSSRTIGEALKSVQPWVDEMIVVDTGSQDETVAIARDCGAVVSEFPWQDSFSAARNESLRRARGRWVFWMDSDDIIDDSNGRQLKALIDSIGSPSIMGCVMQVHCPHQHANGDYSSVTAVDHIKLIRNIPAIQFAGRIHEQVLPSIRSLGGDVCWSDAFVLHAGSDQSSTGKQRKHQRDLRLLELELHDDPDNTFALFNLGMTLVDMGYHERALSPLCRGLQLAQPEESHVRKLYSLLVQAYSGLRRFTTALKTCHQGLTAHPGDPELLFRRGVLEQQMNKWPEAVKSFQEVLKHQPDRYFTSVDRGIFGIKAWHNLALVYEQQAKYSPALEAWRHVVDHEVSNRAAWKGLLDTAFWAKDVAALEDAAARLLNVAKFQDLQTVALARAEVLKGNQSRGIAMLEEATADSSEDTDLLEMLCQLLFENKDWENAEVRLTELTRRSSLFRASAFQNLAIAQAKLGKYDEARLSIEQSLLLRPNYEPAVQLQKYLNEECGASIKSKKILLIGNQLG